MAEANSVLPFVISDTSDSEATNIDLEGLRNNITKLRDSRRRRHNRRKREVAELRALKERYRRDKELWQQKYADKDKQTNALIREMGKLRAQVKLQHLELKAKTSQLERMNHLFCDICHVQGISIVTSCGHGFCKDCLDKWFDTVAKDATLGFEDGEAPCPSCRGKLYQWGDIWPIYMSEAVEQGSTQEQPQTTEIGVR